MSQSKRNADTAFEEDITPDQPRPKKTKKPKEKNRASAGAMSQVSNKPAIQRDSATTHVAAGEKSEGTSSKLEDRITLPPSKFPAVTRTESALTDVSGMQKSKKRKKQRQQPKSQLDNKPTDTSIVLKTSKIGTQSWRSSPASGGVFLNHDPVLSTDGRYLILPLKDQVRIYSVSTSLLVRSITLHKDTVVGCTMSLSNPNALLVITGRGVLTKYDLSSGAKIDQWKLGPGHRSIKVVASTEGGGEEVLAIHSNSTEGPEDRLAHFTISKGGQFTCFHSVHSNKLKGIIIASHDSTYIIVCGLRSIYVGTKVPGLGSKYVWHELAVPGLITSFDAILNQRIEQSGKKSEPTHVVVGLENGPILVYEDLLTKLNKATKSNQKLELTGRKLHWHRNHVRSVKWSRDGNYIISGGDETTLVIWQLETNQRQYLPHLSTSIMNITVSSSGAQYALRLGDNSVMILSTADLAPMTNVTGLSIPAQRNDRLPIQMHPIHANRLLAAVPIRPVNKDAAIATTHLQTYDVETNMQLSRQALTRNVTTTVNVSPEGYLLVEPSVVFLQISSDGYWLATIDRWTPNASDMQALFIKEDDQLTKQKTTETTLRFWLWNEGDNTWELGTRVDEPHAASKYCVLGLASNPKTPEFTTLGEDGFLKIWQPRRRIRNGVQVRDKAGLPLYTWTCAQSVKLEKSFSTVQPFASIAYSEDGSVIAASWTLKNRQVHIVDPTTGSLCMSLPRLLVEGPASLEIVGRHLLCLSNKLRIFDMLTLETTFTIDPMRNQGHWLAVNKSTRTFAIGLNPQAWSEPSAISIYSIETPEQGPLHKFEIPGRILTLLPEHSVGGFILIDRDLKIVKLMPPGITAVSSTALIQASETVENATKRTLQDMFGGDAGVSVLNENQQKLIQGGQTTRNLVDLVSVPSTATQPGVGELFDRISKAIAGGQVRVDA